MSNPFTVHELISDNIYTKDITASEFNSNNIYTKNITGNKLNSDNIYATTITTPELNSDNIYVKTILGDVDFEKVPKFNGKNFIYNINGVNSIQKLTQAEYDALVPSPDTLYIIVE